MFYHIPATPLYGPILGYIAGIITVYTPITLYSTLGTLLTFSLAATIPGYQQPSLKRNFFTALLFFIAGIGITTYKLKPATLPEAFINYRYIVVNYEKVQGSNWPFKITIQTCPRSWWESPLTFLVYTKKKGFLTVGDTVKIPQLIIQQPKDPHFSLYLTKEGFDGTAFAYSLKAYTKEKPLFNILYFIHSIKHYCIEQASEILKPDTYALFLSVFLGNKDEQKQTLDNLRPLFLNWGLSHQLARSGLHLIFFIPFLILLISMLPLPFFLKEILTISIVGIYGLFSWTSISFLRACCCFFILRASILFSFFMPPLHILLLTTLLVLLHNPLQLFFLDFQLSFFLSFALLWMSHVNQLKTLNDRKTLAQKKRISLE